jgi:hypothetical protein
MSSGIKQGHGAKIGEGVLMITEDQKPKNMLWFFIQGVGVILQVGCSNKCINVDVPLRCASFPRQLCER